MNANTGKGLVAILIIAMLFQGCVMPWDGSRDEGGVVTAPDGSVHVSKENTDMPPPLPDGDKPEVRAGAVPSGGAAYDGPPPLPE